MMGTSIKRSVIIRVVCAIITVLLFSGVTTANILRIEGTQEKNAQASALLDRAQKAEAAHYKWASNLSNALYAGTEFTGSIDYTSCVLGQWLYSEMDMDDESINALRSQIEPLHRQLHQSASYVLELLETSPQQAQSYYQQTIQANLSSLVGLLDQVIQRGEALKAQHTDEMNRTIALMHSSTVVCLLLNLVALLSLVQFVLKHVIKPLLLITEKVKPLQEGKLNLSMDYKSRNELGTLAQTLEQSMARIHGYVDDIGRVMAELSRGNFNVRTSVRYIGDFQSIETALDTFTASISGAMESIAQTEQRVSSHAEQLSNGAQALAQGATQQASAVEELYATLDDLSKSAEKNVKTASLAQENARLTGEQVTISGQQMEQMVSAMADITDASQQIGKIIATIENIAFQTNILALNAAVEAARAGSAGKGFAVVSDEVRNLAAKSDQAAKATKELIENSILATEKGSAIVGEVSRTLQRTLELVTQSNSAIGTIAGAIHDEAEGLAQVTEGLGQISSVVQTNSASSQESAAVSSELFDQVHLLEAETRKFKLKQADPLPKEPSAVG